MECRRSTLSNNTSHMLSIALVFSYGEPCSLVLTQLVFLQMTQITIKGTDPVPETACRSVHPPEQYHSPQWKLLTALRRTHTSRALHTCQNLQCSSQAVIEPHPAMVELPAGCRVQKKHNKNKCRIGPQPHVHLFLQKETTMHLTFIL